MREEIYGVCQDCGVAIKEGEGHYNFGGPKLFCADCGEKKVSPGLVI